MAANTYAVSFENQPAVILANHGFTVDFSLTRTGIGAMNQGNPAQDLQFRNSSRTRIGPKEYAKQFGCDP
jgi:hypothetical protein